MRYSDIATAYHGSPMAKKIDVLKPSRGGELGAGLYFSYNLKVAHGYSLTNNEDGQSPHAGVLRLDLSKLLIKPITRNEWIDDRATIMDQLRADNQGEWKREFANQAEKILINRYEQEGYDGLYDDWDQGIVFPDRVHKVKFWVDNQRSMS